MSGRWLLVVVMNRTGGGGGSSDGVFEHEVRSQVPLVVGVSMNKIMLMTKALKQWRSRC